MEHKAPSTRCDPDRTESYPLLTVRKPAPAGDRHGDAEGSPLGGPSGVRAGVLSGAHLNSYSGGGGVGRQILFFFFYKLRMNPLLACSPLDVKRQIRSTMVQESPEDAYLLLL